jgi:hypothetical protein
MVEHAAVGADMAFSLGQIAFPGGFCVTSWHGKPPSNEKWKGGMTPEAGACCKVCPAEIYDDEGEDRTAVRNTFGAKGRAPGAAV